MLRFISVPVAHSCPQSLLKGSASAGMSCPKHYINQLLERGSTWSRISTMLMNLQKLLLFSSQLRHTIKNVDYKDLMKLALEHGSKLSQKELSNIYGLIVVLESFISISLFHDRFGEMKSIKRLTQEGIWIGLKLDKDFLDKQEILNDDLQFVNDNESSISEITFILRAVNQKVKEYFEFDKNMKNR